MSKLTEKIGPEWVPCVKLPVIVHVREQRPGEKHVSTREGLTPVKPDDLIMRGVAGEEYPIGRELWKMTYTTDTAPQPAATEPLLQRIAELEENERAFKQVILQMQDSIDFLQRQLEEARKDAELYRQLRNGNSWPAVFASHDAPEPLRGEELDAAMQKGQS